VKEFKPVLQEVREIAAAVRGQPEEDPAGPVLVTGMLAEQLARQLSDGASPGAVVAGDRALLDRASVLVHVIAGELTAEDDELVRTADRLTVPVVLVQIWPQEDWTPPFVRSAFVVECQAGAGFPAPEIAARIVEAVDAPVGLASRVPVLEDVTSRSLITSTIVRSALLAAGFAGKRGARPLITLEQLAMVAALRELQGRAQAPPDPKLLAGTAAGVAGTGFLLREVARFSRRLLPRPVADAAVAAGATWLIGVGARRFGNR
jgi:hypothetical protein